MTTRKSKAIAATLPLLVSGILLLIVSCHKQETPAPPVSSIAVETRSDGIHFLSTHAEFLLTSNGALLGRQKSGSQWLTLDDAASNSGILLEVDKHPVSDFVRDLAHARILPANGKLGSLGKRLEVQGHSASSGLDELLAVEVYDDFPSLALLSTTYKNSGQKDIAFDSVTLQNHSLNASLADSAVKPHEMWAFFGSSLKWGKDDVLPIPAKFSQENPFGTPVETRDDLGRVGGGVPVVAFWTNNTGLAIGHLETLPLAISIPVQTTPGGTLNAAVAVPANTTLKPGETFATPRTFVTVFHGDYYEPLHTWSEAVEREGLARPKNNDENYAVSWCGWGYESNVTPKQMLDTVPKLKELGIHWATLDDRWFNNYGDWQPRKETFPGDSMQQMVRDFHKQGMLVQLWWLPLGVEDGQGRWESHKYLVSDVVREHPDWLILDKNGRHGRITRDLAALCPAVPEVQDYYKKLTERFIRDWDFDGSKLDNIYTVPECHNPAHHHKSPQDSVNAMADVYRVIYQTTRALKPESVTQSCPCGTPPSLAWLPYMDQAVTADPVGAVQVRRRIKMYKALLGPEAAVYGDHVELSAMTRAGKDWIEHGDDFASTIGAGGVVGTKFVWPDPGPKFKRVNLTKEKEAHWKKWIAVYNDKMLSKGNFLPLYVYGYDAPEAYAIEKDGRMYYAFFAASTNSAWHGEVELRGLPPGTYNVLDYADNKSLGTVTVSEGTNPRIKTEFKEHLLLEVTRK